MDVSVKLIDSYEKQKTYYVRKASGCCSGKIYLISVQSGFLPSVFSPVGVATPTRLPYYQLSRLKNQLKIFPNYILNNPSYSSALLNVLQSVFFFLNTRKRRRLKSQNRRCKFNMTSSVRVRHRPLKSDAHPLSRNQPRVVLSFVNCI